MREYQAPLRLLEKKIYFSSQNAAAGDVFQVIPVLSGDVLLASWVEVLTACTAGTTVDLGYGSVVDYFGNAMSVATVGKCEPILTGSLTVRAFDIPKNMEATEEVEIDGARIGDVVIVTPSRFFSDLAMVGEVINDDSVAVHLINNTEGTLNLNDHEVNIQVHKAPRAASPIVFTAGDTIDVIANEAITAGVLKVSALIARK